MADRYAALTGSPLAPILSRLGLPRIPALVRTPGLLPAVAEGVAVGASPGATLGEAVGAAVGELGLKEVGEGRIGAALYDASGLDSAEALVELQRFFTPVVGRVAPSGRVVILTVAPQRAANPRHQAAQRGVQGFARSLGKELGRKGTTVNLLEVGEGGEVGVAAALAFLLSGRSAYLSGQVIPLGAPAHPLEAATPPLAGKRAVVTGAARGIGAAIAAVLAREGAEVVGADVAALRSELEGTVGRLGGKAVTVDVTAAEAAERLLDAAEGQIDVIVHNAGITRDRTLARMDERRFAAVIKVNALAVERINGVLLEQGAIQSGGRILCLSSVAGIAGNAGQTNYAAAKAYLIGHVKALAAEVAGRGATINGIAPGFIETQMTAAMPFAIREVGRRLNSLLQGGLPQDVAEAVGWLADPRSAAVNGAVVRVCGQSFLGA